MVCLYFRRKIKHEMITWRRRCSGLFCSNVSRSMWTISNSISFSRRQSKTLCGQAAVTCPYTFTTIFYYFVFFFVNSIRKSKDQFICVILNLCLPIFIYKWKEVRDCMCWHFIKDSGRLFMVVVAGWVEHVVVVPPTVIPFIYSSLL